VSISDANICDELIGAGDHESSFTATAHPPSPPPLLLPAHA